MQGALTDEDVAFVLGFRSLPDEVKPRFVHAAKAIVSAATNEEAEKAAAEFREWVNARNAAKKATGDEA